MKPSSILITGCSSGIGLRAAEILQKRGYRVFASVRKLTDLERLRQMGFEAVQLDVNDSNSMRHALDRILQLTSGTLDALFNNAGYLQAGAIEDLNRDDIRAQFETNVFGPMELIRLVLPIMRKQGHGRIVQNSSILGMITLPYYGAYNASKFALDGFTNTLRQELAGTAISVSSINPGAIYSELRNKAFDHYQQSLADQKEQSPHASAYAALEQNYFDTRNRKDAFTASPDAVVKKLIHALESNHPHAHYYVGRGAFAMSLARRLLPDAALDWITAKIK